MGCCGPEQSRFLTMCQGLEFGPPEGCIWLSGDSLENPCLNQTNPNTFDPASKRCSQLIKPQLLLFIKMAIISRQKIAPGEILRRGTPRMDGRKLFSLLELCWKRIVCLRIFSVHFGIKLCIPKEEWKRPCGRQSIILIIIICLHSHYSEHALSIL